jgi:hypothetical protein
MYTVGCVRKQAANLNLYHLFILTQKIPAYKVSTAAHCWVRLGCLSIHIKDAVKLEPTTNTKVKFSL